MHTYLLSTGRVISPFGQPAGEMKVHGRPLHVHQEEVLRALGCTVERIDGLNEVRRWPCLLIFDDLYFTYHALAGFLKAVKRRQCCKPPAGSARSAGSAPGNARAALRSSELTELIAPAFQGVKVAGPDGASYRAYHCYYLTALDPEQPLGSQAELLPILHKVKRVRTRANRYFEPSGKFTLPVAKVFCTPIEHWASLVAANVLGMPSFLLRTAWQRPAAVASLPLRMLWRAGSLRPSRWLEKLYLAGPRCRIHPSAVVEGAVLGRRVKIGPNAVVRGAVIGDETEIGPGAIVEGCTLGQRVTVVSGAVIRCSVADDEASLGSFFTQFSVIGRSAVMCPDSGIFDFQFKGSVRVACEGRTVPSGSRLLGGCLGDRVFLGPGVHLLCGQEIPNDCVLVENPRELVRSVQELPERIVRIDRAGRDEARRLRRAS